MHALSFPSPTLAADSTTSGWYKNQWDWHQDQVLEYKNFQKMVGSRTAALWRHLSPWLSVVESLGWGWGVLYPYKFTLAQGSLTFWQAYLTAGSCKLTITILPFLHVLPLHTCIIKDTTFIPIHFQLQSPSHHTLLPNLCWHIQESCQLTF